jgi:aminoglycoside phosphotransferase (APT) family kinase protein
MNASERGEALSTIVAAVTPGARLVGSTSFRGGLSSEMVLVEAELGDGSRRRFVVRRARGERGSIPIAVEYRLLETVWARGLPVPEPLLLDESGTVSEQPYMVLAYVDGSPRVTDDDPVETSCQLADVLASIHEIDGSGPALTDLPRRTTRVARKLDERRGAVDDSLREGRILEVLRSHWPPDPPERPSLLHFGRDAVRALTEHYTARTGADLRQLALWDLAAALRPAGEISAWATDWANYGRPDMTPARMRTSHHWFVDDALAALDD